MLDQLSHKRTPLAGWIWGEARDIDFDTVFCPFAGRPNVPVMFKEQGKSVITADLLLAHYHLCNTLIENSSSLLDPFMVDKLLEKNNSRVQLLEGVCNAYDLAPEHGAWFDNVYANIIELENEHLKSLAMAVCSKVISYLLAFDAQTRAIMPDDDLAGAFNYYVEFYNSKVFYNGKPCEAHLADAFDIACSVDTQAMYFYIPSTLGFDRLSSERRLLELFCRHCTEAELDKLLHIDSSRLGSSQTEVSSYISTIERFLEKTKHIQNWLISYNTAGVLSVDQVRGIIGKFKPEVRVAETRIFHPADETITEVLFAARG